MADGKTKLAVRLMLRAEGEWWNAYFGVSPADPDTVQVGSIRMSVVTKNPKAKEAFVRLMSDVAATVIHDVYGERPEMKLEAAPESERAGNA